MQTYWEHYRKPIEGHPAALAFDAGISMEIDDLTYTHPMVGFVKVMLHNPGADGLAKPEEAEAIEAIEAGLEAGILKFRIGKYVGRIITQGSVTFLFYLQFTYNWDEFLAFALEGVDPTYTITAGYEHDMEWNYYRKLLFPTDRQWQLIQNHKVCYALRAQGDNLITPRPLTHTLYYTATDPRRSELIAHLKSEGFQLGETITNDDGIEGQLFVREDSPAYDRIDPLTLYLIDLLERYGATYDGWEAPILTSR